MVAVLAVAVFAVMLAVDFYEGAREYGGLRAYCAACAG